LPTEFMTRMVAKLLEPEQARIGSAFSTSDSRRCVVNDNVQGVVQVQVQVNVNAI